MKNIVVIDNYDSFTYNLVHYLEMCNAKVTVVRNNAFELDELEKFDKIVLSPGPGIPSEAGLLKAVIQKYSGSKSILGVCLGQQAIGEVFGGSLVNLDKVHHGVSSIISLTVTDETLFEGLPHEFEVGRYHSWVISKDNFPDELEITSIDADGNIMSIRHRKFDVKGVQFHPESVMTPQGKKMIENWILQ